MQRKTFIKIIIISPIASIFLSCADGKDPRLAASHPGCSNNLTDNEKASRDLYDYVEKSFREKEYCGNCTYWIDTETKEQCGGCTLFKGPVNYAGWCRQFLLSPPFLST